MRYFLALLTVALAVGFANVSFANDVKLRKYTADDVKGACAKVGGKFSQDDSGYGCGTTCHGAPGTDCTVFCKAGEACYAQVIGARRPRDLVGALRLPPGRDH